MNLVDKIAHLNPCNEGKIWLNQYTNRKTAWNECKKPNWMLWYIDRTSGKKDSPSRKKLVKTLFDIASLCKPCEDKELEQLRQQCIKAGYDYCEGKATSDELKTARDKLWYAYSTDAAAAVYAADAVAAADATKAGVTSKQQLTIIRQNYPSPPKINTKRE